MIRIAVIASLPLLLASPALADTAWSAAQCGSEPHAPGVSVTSVAQYNASVDAVQAYEKAARAYNACVSQHAEAEETAISDDARARIARIQAGSSMVQKHIAANFTALSQALKTGAQKLGGH